MDSFCLSPPLDQKATRLPTVTQTIQARYIPSILELLTHQLLAQLPQHIRLDAASSPGQDLVLIGVGDVAVEEVFAIVL